MLHALTLALSIAAQPAPDGTADKDADHARQLPAAEKILRLDEIYAADTRELDQIKQALEILKKRMPGPRRRSASLMTGGPARRKRSKNLPRRARKPRLTSCRRQPRRCTAAGS